MTAEPTPIYRRDYRPPAYWIDKVQLHFELDDHRTLVTSRLELRRNDDPAADQGASLLLDGEALEFLSAKIDGETLSPEQYNVHSDKLEILNPPKQFLLETQVHIDPKNNTRLSGLYQSSGTFCTQCEAEGFRRITYFLDRPDVMARFQSTLVADPKRFPVLLSNGNKVHERMLEDGRKEVCWEDPHPKPAYLFALVGGDLSCLRDSFTTKSGREVALEIWVPEADLPACGHAMQSLKDAMAWDEKRYGLEYDLDIYMIVAVGDFNMGAMENKGLNVFNTKCVLAQSATATDDDFERVAAVIAHEYFHNWTGNRVTCKDWFQLTLKEGLTVFRDSQFTSDHGSAAVKRIDDVKVLRRLQFPEDAGPMAHPIRPESYIEMNNFYTVTVYEKGSEVVRMYETLLGREGFRKGMDLYFERHDGQAVTCDDFRAAMADANKCELDLFERWYSDPGTPTLHAHSSYDAQAKRFDIRLRQEGPAAPGQSSYRPRHIPVLIGLVGPDGQDLQINPSELPKGVSTSETPGSYLIELRELEESFSFESIDKPVVPSILREFSAPIKRSTEVDPQALAFLMGHDSDSFNRWDAGQQLGRFVLLDLIAAVQANKELALPELYVEAFGQVLKDHNADASLRALALLLPAEDELGQAMPLIDPDAIHEAREFALRTLAQRFEADFEELYRSLASKSAHTLHASEISRRRLRNVALSYLCCADPVKGAKLAFEQQSSADNMSESQAAMHCLLRCAQPETERALASFYERWKSDPLVLDKWFSMQAMNPSAQTVDQVRALSEHADFTQRNPNRFRSLMGSFGRNQLAFHRKDGEGYRLLADQVLAADALNPQAAARCVAAFNSWQRFDADRQALMKAQLERMSKHPELSKDLYEIVRKNLDSASS